MNTLFSIVLYNARTQFPKAHFSVIMMDNSCLHVIQVWPGPGGGRVLCSVRHHRLHRRKPMEDGGVPRRGRQRAAPRPAVAVETQRRPGPAVRNPEEELDRGEDVQRQRHRHGRYGAPRPSGRRRHFTEKNRIRRAGCRHVLE